MRSRWGQKELAYRINLLDRGCRCDDVTVSRWERAVQRPTPLYEELLSLVFEDIIVGPAPAAFTDQGDFVRHALGFAPPSSIGSIRHSWDQTSRALSAADARNMDRLEYVTRTLHQLEQKVLALTSQVGTSDVDRRADGDRPNEPLERTDSA